MRFLPNINYGTEGYPEKVARRLRAVNLSAWIVTGLSAGFAGVQFLDPTPGVWKAAAVSALAASLFALIPLLHRFGPYAAALALLFVGYADSSVVIWLLGTGMPKFYLVAAALTLLYFGAERIALSALFGVLSIVLAIVPHDTGMLSCTRSEAATESLLVHKPVQPMRLRAMVNQLLRSYERTIAPAAE
jgi:adenylate cyclase